MNYISKLYQIIISKLTVESKIESFFEFTKKILNITLTIGTEKQQNHTSIPTETNNYNNNTYTQTIQTISDNETSSEDEGDTRNIGRLYEKLEIN